MNKHQTQLRIIPLLTLTAVMALAGCNQTNTGTGTVPAERVGLDGEYDQNGLAKRVIQAFEADSELAPIETVYVAQSGKIVILKGTIPNAETLDKMVNVAEDVEGVSQVETDQVTVRP
ncbi:MAG: BON domain-containing protein [Microcoleaceae cyanobacterium]